MKKLLIFAILFASGCVGHWNGNPNGKQYNTYLRFPSVEKNDEPRENSQLEVMLGAVRFRADKTRRMAAPRLMPPKVDENDPWADFEHPRLFPFGWKHAKKEKPI